MGCNPMGYYPMDTIHIMDGLGDFYSVLAVFVLTKACSVRQPELDRFDFCI